MRGKTCLAALLLSTTIALAQVSSVGSGNAGSERWQRYNGWKFGMFIHWGPYSLASVEASWPIMTPPREDQRNPAQPAITEAEYRGLASRFNPVHYDPRAWVHLAQMAGQRYMVFTTKHHDGFCMFDSAYTEYKITKTPYGKDVVAMLAAAAHEEKMPLGFYYSPPDMTHPGYRDTTRPASANWHGEPWRPEWPLYLDYMELQVTELLKRYGDVAVVWFDGLDEQRKYDGHRFQRLIRELQPGALINNRIGFPGDFSTPEQRIPDGIPTRSSTVGATNPAEDAGLSKQVPRPGDFQPWETCMTINDTWAYNRNDRNFKPASELIRTLVDVASRGGNLLLNVGPTPEGTIQPEFEERLLVMGAWLKTNGEAIYGTTYGPWQNLPFGRTTAKGKTVYLHVFQWAGGSVEIPAAGVKVGRVMLLADRRPLEFSQNGYSLRIKLPPAAPDPAVSVLAIETR
jgi:alpha-L-fucosidase